MRESASYLSVRSSFWRDPVGYSRRNAREVLSLSIVDIYALDLPDLHSRLTEVRQPIADWQQYSEPPLVDSAPSSFIPRSVLESLGLDGSTLWIGFLGGRAVSYISVQSRRKKIAMRQYFRLIPGEFFIGPYYTDPGYRGLGLAGEGLHQVVGSLLEEESTSIAYLDISRFNAASIRVATRLGARTLSSFYLLIRLLKRDRFCIPFGLCRDRVELVGCRAFASGD